MLNVTTLIRRSFDMIIRSNSVIGVFSRTVCSENFDAVENVSPRRGKSAFRKLLQTHLAWTPLRSFGYVSFRQSPRFSSTIYKDPTDFSAEVNVDPSFIRNDFIKLNPLPLRINYMNFGNYSLSKVSFITSQTHWTVDADRWAGLYSQAG